MITTDSAKKKTARNKAYYAANKEKIAARNKAYYAANKEKIRNKEKIAAYLKAVDVVNKYKNIYYQEMLKDEEFVTEYFKSMLSMRLKRLSPIYTKPIYTKPIYTKYAKELITNPNKLRLLIENIESKIAD